MRIKYFVVFQVIFILFSLLSFAQISDTLKVYYSIDSCGLEGEFRNDINNFLKKDVKEVKVFSYTDFLGPIFYNQNLSQRRANQVRNYLVEQGVPKSLIAECKGMGIYPNSSLDYRTNPDDRGVVRHRVSYVVFVYKEEVGKEVDNKNVIGNSQDVDLDQIEEVKEESVVIPIFENLTTENMEVGENIVLDNILFHGGTPNFKPESESSLNQLYLAMKNNPTLEIEIEGHICCEKGGEDGWDRINQNDHLSENRAKAVYDFLVEKGIDSKRMTYIGYGSKFKLYPKERNAYEEDHNRRVEIRIVKK